MALALPFTRRFVLLLVLLTGLATSGATLAVGRLADVQIVDRSDGRTLPVFYKDGQAWIVGTPGHEYIVRVENHAGDRVLAVTSVDGVNVVTGETASPSQSGYVLAPGGTVEITGWRKSLGTAATFYFTDLGDAYATRTGRPENVGVIGVALFRERPRPVPLDDLRLGEAPRHSARAAQGAQDSTARTESAMPSAPAPMASLGTGHGREEASVVQRVRFQRATSSPAEVITIRYDRRENLIAMGVLPPAPIASGPRAFPEWTGRFVPDPPSR